MTGPLRQRSLRSRRHSGHVAAGQLGPRRDAIARAETACTPWPDFDDAGAELVAEELHRGLGLQPALDAVVGERRDAEARAAPR